LSNDWESSHEIVCSSACLRLVVERDQVGAKDEQEWDRVEPDCDLNHLEELVDQPADLPEAVEVTEAVVDVRDLLVVLREGFVIYLILVVLKGLGRRSASDLVQELGGIFSDNLLGIVFPDSTPEGLIKPYDNLDCHVVQDDLGVACARQKHYKRDDLDDESGDNLQQPSQICKWCDTKPVWVVDNQLHHVKTQLKFLL